MAGSAHFHHSPTMLCVFVGLCLLATASAGPQYVKIEGILTCGERPASGITVRLEEKDMWPDTDDTLDVSQTGPCGNFSVEGSNNEMLAIEPVLVVQHNCALSDKRRCMHISEIPISTSCVSKDANVPVCRVDQDLTKLTPKDSKCHPRNVWNKERMKPDFSRCSKIFVNEEVIVLEQGKTSPVNLTTTKSMDTTTQSSTKAAEEVSIQESSVQENATGVSPSPTPVPPKAATVVVSSTTESTTNEMIRDASTTTATPNPVAKNEMTFD